MIKKRLVFILFVFGLVFGFFKFVLAEKNWSDINFFYSPTCPHCVEEEDFLDGLEKKYPEIKINRFSVFEKKNVNLLKDFYAQYKVPSGSQGMVPVTFTNKRFFLGFNEEIGENIESCILECRADQAPRGNISIFDLEGNINFPLVGKINVEKYSLSFLAVILGVLDGFNVCSLGALVLILGLVLTVKSRKKTLLFGGIFIITTAFVYGLLIIIWYQIFSFLVPYIRFMEILIGLLGLGGGLYFFKEFLKFRKQGPVCEPGVGKGIMAGFSSKFRNSLKKSASIFLPLGSVLLFAAIITVVEFPCSAVVPVAFAGILTQAELSSFSYLFYIAVFLVFYMLDEIIVFLVAFFTAKIWLASSKAIAWIILIEALVLFGLGIFYLF